MARSKKSQLTMENLFYFSPEQKVLRLLISEPTTTFTSRALSSKLKGVRGLGGGEGIMRILTDFQGLGLVDFVDNHRAVRLRDDSPLISVFKQVAAICDLESLRTTLEPISVRGVLYGSRANGRFRSDSNYDLFVVSDIPEEVKKSAARHPLAKDLDLTVWTPELFDNIEKNEPGLFGKLTSGIVLWGPTW
ncbi:MAG: nucleotidyltransferase domain-containing protein [Bdellovibrionota bacterium]